MTFATYTRDSYTGLDYANQRFYASTYGRFNTADSFAASAGPGDPGSWNRYSYTRGDPVNRIDPRGTCDITISGWGFNDFMFPYTSCDASLGSDINPAALTECFAVNTCLANFQAALGGSGGVIQTFAGPNNITVTGYSRTGPNETTITNDLNDILNQVLTGPCGTWLTGPDFSASQLINALETGGAGGGPTYGYGALNSNTTAAFVGNNYANGTPIPGLPVDASITVNTNGAFFSSGFTVGSGNAQYTGGTLQAQIFHELAHLVGAANFVPDAGNSTAVSNNNQLVQQNCGKQIAGVH